MKSVAVFALKGGVGKSTIAVSLAHASATQSGRRTLLWDLDSQGAASWLVDAGRRNGPKARAGVSGDADLAAMAVATRWPNLMLLPADRSLRHLESDLAAADDAKQLRRRLKRLAEGFDRVILDCPPGLSTLALRLFRAVDLLVVPLLPSPLAGRTLDQLRAELARLPGGGPLLLPLWNLADRRRRLHRTLVEAEPGWPVIPAAAVVERMALARAPLAELAPASAPARAVQALWTRVELALLKG